MNSSQKPELEKYHFLVIAKLKLAAHILKASAAYFANMKWFFTEKLEYSTIKSELEMGIAKAEIALEFAKEALDEMNK